MFKSKNAQVLYLDYWCKTVFGVSANQLKRQTQGSAVRTNLSKSKRATTSLFF